MITGIELSHFKCFEKFHIPLSKLTLFTGPNASGKSSVIQALTLLSQSMNDHEWANRLSLNGTAINLGTITDVVDQLNGRNTFGIGIISDEHYLGWQFVGERKDLSCEVEKIFFDEDFIDNPNISMNLLPNLHLAYADKIVDNIKRMTFVNAERMGPQEIYPLIDYRDSNVVGTNGEYAISLLYINRDERVLAGIELDGIPLTMFHQVSARMCQFFPGFQMSLEPVGHTNSVVLGIRTSNDTDFHRPINVGYGITQILPIIIAGLSAKPGETIVVENPEIHLHPSGQSLMGIFLSEVASNGVQVIIETHSDHVLNGIRRAVKSGIIGCNDTTIHFFCQRKPNSPQIYSPEITETGLIDFWPSDFFDQYDKDLNYLVGWSD